MEEKLIDIKGDIIYYREDTEYSARVHTWDDVVVNPSSDWHDQVNVCCKVSADVTQIRNYVQSVLIALPIL